MLTCYKAHCFLKIIFIKVLLKVYCELSKIWSLNVITVITSVLQDFSERVQIVKRTDLFVRGNCKQVLQNQAQGL